MAENLIQQLQTLQKELNEAYLQKNVNKLKNTATIKNLRLKIARLKTTLRQQDNKENK
ncbi:50S ribosomal protein L29 [Microgenomates group bacterium]|nr:50S ribosomal protein L29 [Microgenomates group bacterium]